jgi:acetyl esterase/lipase
MTARDFSGLPPAHIVTAGVDPLCPQAQYSRDTFYLWAFSTTSASADNT